MQSRNTTKAGQFQSGTHNGQGGGHGHHGPGGLHKPLTLQDTNTYKVYPKDPTSQLKNKLISLLKDIKQTGGLNTNKYKQLFLTSTSPPSFMAFPKYIK